MMRCFCAAMYVVAGITTAAAIKEVHHQVCTPWPYAVYIAIAAVWPIAGAAIAVAEHAPSKCGASQ